MCFFGFALPFVISAYLNRLTHGVCGFCDDCFHGVVNRLAVHQELDVALLSRLPFGERLRLLDLLPFLGLVPANNSRMHELKCLCCDRKMEDVLFSCHMWVERQVVRSCIREQGGPSIGYNICCTDTHSVILAANTTGVPTERPHAQSLRYHV